MASQLPLTARKRAATFILDNGNNLQRMRYAFHFAGGNADSVLQALLDYQNQDGGFGHGLEQDLRTRNSSVICTTIALQIMEEVEIPQQHALIPRTMNYLESQFQHRNWPVIAENCNDAPHAPWWQFDKTWACTDKFLANPGAEILGYLLLFGTGLSNRIVNDLLRRALEHLQQYDLEMHELLSFYRLYHCKYLGENYRQFMLPLLLEQAFRLVKVEPRDWEEYGLTPLVLVDRPESVFNEFFGSSLEVNFAYQIRQQSEEGCWLPRWSWGGAYPATWKVVETEIKVELTLKFLIQLNRFGLLDSS
jgi:hypothetical protein